MDNENSNSFLWVDDALEYLDTSNTGEKEIVVSDNSSSNESSDYIDEDDTDSSSCYIPKGTIPDYLVDYYFNTSSSSGREIRRHHLDHISRRNYKDISGIRGAATQRRDRYESKRSGASITPKRRRKIRNKLKKTKRIIVLNSSP